MQTEHEQHGRSNAGGAGWIFIVIGLLLVIGPIAASRFLATGAQLVLVGIGVLTLLVGGIVIIISKLYVKARASEAFVRTGMGGRKAVIDGGAIVIPAVHEVTYVTLETMRVDVVRRGGEEALLTADLFRADIAAEFFLKVQKKEDDVLAAAQSLGGKFVTGDAVKMLVEKKLVSALRSVAATKSLVELNQNRKAYTDAVQVILGDDLKQNGFTLESVTISYLDQTPRSGMRADDNIFDAKGAKELAKIVAEQRVERNRIETDAAQAVEQQNVENRKKILMLEQEKEAAEAEQGNRVAQAHAQAKRESEAFQAEQTKLSRVATTNAEREAQLAEVERQQDLEVAEQRRRQAAEAARINAERAIEVSNREKLSAIADAEAKKAEAEKAKLDAEAGREQANQNVQTVAARAEAERSKVTQVIAQQAQSERKKIELVTNAEAQAQERVLLAQADKEAAENAANAKRIQAEAEKDAQTAQAAGDRAVQMVPVEVERTRVEVERQSLANQSEFDKIARGLKEALAQINAMKEVEIARAQALGQAMQYSKMTIWGTPDQLEAMTRRFIGGQATGQWISGLQSSVPPEIATIATNAVEGLGATAAAVIKKIAGVDVSADQLEAFLKKFAESNASTEG